MGISLWLLHGESPNRIFACLLFYGHFVHREVLLGLMFSAFFFSFHSLHLDGMYSICSGTKHNEWIVSHRSFQFLNSKENHFSDELMLCMKSFRK